MDVKQKTEAEWKAENMCSGTHAPLELRQELIAHFAATGSAQACADKFSYSVETVRRWMKSDWWGPLLNECSERNRDELVAKQCAIITAAYDQLAERMKNGDHVLHQGELRRVPVPAKHLATIAESTMKSHALVTGATAAPSNVINLDALADKLRAIAVAAQATEANERKKLDIRN